MAKQHTKNTPQQPAVAAATATATTTATTTNVTNNNLEDLTQRLDQMEMDATQSAAVPSSGEPHQILTQQLERRHQVQCQPSIDVSMYEGDDDDENAREASAEERNKGIQIYKTDAGERRMSVDEENVQPARPAKSTSGRRKRNSKDSSSKILIVTNVDPAVFSDSLVKAKFESLFKAYDERILFRYLKSFRRVRLDFSTAQEAERARVGMNNYKLGNTTIKCYLAQMIRPSTLNSSLDTNDDDDDDDEDDDEDGETNDEDEHNPFRQNRNYLSIPKRSKQFLLSPPISPPEGWAPQEEATPCIDVQLISALANLVPGEMHELHEGNESQPHIFVEVCEEVKQDPHLRTISSARGRIPKTPSPQGQTAPPSHKAM